MFGKEYCFGFSKELLLSELTQSMVDSLIANRIQEKLMNSSINVELRFLKRIWNVSQKRFNTGREIEIKTLKAKPKSRYLTQQEQDLMLEILKSSGNTVGFTKARNLAIFLLDTGARISEAMDLRWSDVDFDSRRVNLYRRKTESWSLIPMTDRCVAALMNHRDLKYPFPSMDRSIKHLRNAINIAANNDPRIVRTKGKATIHTLRDTFGARMTMAKIPSFALQQLMGHQNIMTTQKYAQMTSVDSAMMAEAVFKEKGMKK